MGNRHVGSPTGAVPTNASAHGRCDAGSLLATVEPVTVEPVTVEPVTVEPVTVEPVTVEPVTVEP
jgi:hypothetical protein